MSGELKEKYDQVRAGKVGYYEGKRGLIAVWGKEALQFLDGLISNDMKTLDDGVQMMAAFPNAQGRLLAVVRVLRQGDRFLFETEEVTREKVFQNLFRFTFAGDFYVEDISSQYRFIELFGLVAGPPPAYCTVSSSPQPYDEFGYRFNGASGNETIALKGSGAIRNDLIEIPDDLYETLRIECGIPKYGVDMDETTIVPELGIGGLISYNKGCYIGQEIIARIHFRGHVAKQLTGLFLEGDVKTGAELTTSDGKNAGRITSVAFSPKLAKHIALAFVRYDHLTEGTELLAEGQPVTVTNLPFIH